MKIPNKIDADKITRIGILGKILPTKSFATKFDLVKREGLQIKDSTELYSVFEDKSGNLTFVVNTELSVDQIEADIFFGNNVNEVIISGVLFIPSSKDPLPDTILKLPKLERLHLDPFDSIIFSKNICHIENL